MAKLIYAAITSLDGFVADEHGNFDWAAPDDEVHAAVNDVASTVGTYLFGRRMYEVMAVWEDPAIVVDQPPVMHDFAQLWHSADKVVYSTTLNAAPTARTRLERTFDVRAVQELKASAERDLAVGGPGLAAHALRAGLVDECHLFLNPVVVGGGTRSLPADVHITLELLHVRRFASGVVHLHHRVTPVREA